MTQVIRQRIKQYETIERLKAQELTCSQIAERLNTSCSHISRFLHGKYSTNLTLLPYDLTPAEYDIAVLLSSSKSILAIAQELYLSKKTIYCHLTSIYKKLGVNNNPLIDKRTAVVIILRDLFLE